MRCLVAVHSHYCRLAANHLCEDSVLNAYSDSCIVVYLVFPFDHVTKSPATYQNQALLYKCLASIAEITSKKGNLNLILQPIPIGHVIDKRADATKVKSLCFSVFNKSRRVTVMTNKSNHAPSTPTMSSHTNTVSTALSSKPRAHRVFSRSNCSSRVRCWPRPTDCLKRVSATCPSYF